MKTTKIALVQINSAFGQVKKNLDKISLFVKQAAKQGVDIICFPELAVQGYSRDQSHLYCETIPGTSSRLLTTLAKNYNITILIGIAEQPESADKPFITQLVAMADGRFEKYRKTHLGESEKPYFSPGNTVPVFHSKKANFGIQICWDLHFPELSTVMSLNGAEIIFAPHASPTIAGSRKDIWLKYLTARAYDNTAYIAACNLVGNNGINNIYSGGALVIDPKGNVFAEDFNNQESMLVVDLDADLINKIRYQKTTTMKNIFYLDARRPELYKA
ncbi:MAG: nitrilase [Firmicutes bacterium]|nr:nitrilase [Bacillota bacterium]